LRKTPNFFQKWAKIAEICDHNIDLRSQSFNFFNLQLQRWRCSRLESFSKQNTVFSVQNALDYPWRCKNLQRQRRKNLQLDK
jgi:hypothetical protein